MQPDLSPAAGDVLERIKRLSLPEQAAILQQTAGLLAEAASRVSPARGAQMGAALSAELAAATPVKTASHGFKIVTAADGKIAVQFIKKLDDGKTVTSQLCEGARKIPYEHLAQYGNEKLKGATLKTHSEFQEMVEELFKAVKGLMVANGELQTEDEALKLAFKIVREGVRREGGGSWVIFDTEDKDGGRAVSGRRIRRSDFLWGGLDGRIVCAFFGVSSPESKKALPAFWWVDFLDWRNLACSEACMTKSYIVGYLRLNLPGK